MLQTYFFYDLFLWWHSFVHSSPVGKTPNTNTAHLPTEKLNIHRHYTVVVVTPILLFLFCFGRRRVKLDFWCLIWSANVRCTCELFSQWYFYALFFPFFTFSLNLIPKVKETVDETKLDSVISYLDYACMKYDVPMMCLHWSYLYWDIIYVSVVYCDIVIHKLISYCMAWLKLHFMLLLFLFIFPYRFSTFFSAKFILRLVLYVWIHQFHIRPIVHIVYRPKFGSTIPSISFWALQSSQGKLKSTSWEVNEVIWPKWKRWVNTNY